jgi:hypothetical protein
MFLSYLLLIYLLVKRLTISTFAKQNGKYCIKTNPIAYAATAEIC